MVMLGELLNARLRAPHMDGTCSFSLCAWIWEEICLAEQLESIFCIQMSSTSFASASRSCWQPSTRSLRGSESRVTWSRRSRRSNTCLSLSARFPSSCRHKNNFYGLLSRRICKTHDPFLARWHEIFAHIQKHATQSAVYCRAVLFGVSHKHCSLHCNIVAYFWINQPWWKCSK